MIKRLPAAPALGPSKVHDARFDDLFGAQERATLLETADRQLHRAGTPYTLGSSICPQSSRASGNVLGQGGSTLPRYRRSSSLSCCFEALS
jgi:hypothetical protein